MPTLVDAQPMLLGIVDDAVNMGSDALGNVSRKRDAIELTEFKYAILLPLIEWLRGL